MQKKINKNTFLWQNHQRVFEFSATPSTVLSIVLERKELFRIICHEIACIVEAKGNAIENEHHSVPFSNCIGKFDGILFRIHFFILSNLIQFADFIGKFDGICFRIHFFILSNLIESLQLKYNQAIVQHGNSHEYHTNQYVGS